MKKIKVLVVDDSPVFRTLLTQIIRSDAELEVIAAAEDPYEARELIKKLNPDVLTLDIEMPKMNGVQFLKNLMRLRPMPVVMISTLTQHGADATLTALELGAVDYFPKPAVENTADLTGYKELINEKIKTAARANVFHQDVASKSSVAEISGKCSNTDIIAIGASTGGTEAIKKLLSQLPAGLPPIVMTQHISALFSPSFARRLDDHSAIHVQELSEQQVVLEKGHAYLAPGDQHLVVIRKGDKLIAVRDDRPLVSRHKPSVDVMFDSVAETVGSRAIGIILTGMGQDGAQGLLKIQQSGGQTIAQDKATSVVWGMPRVAVEMNAADYILSLDSVAGKVCSLVVSEE